MKNGVRLFAIIAIFLTSLYLWVSLDPIASSKYKEEMLEDGNNQKLKVDDVLVQISRSDGTMDTIPLEEYVMGVVASEMPASFELEALKAQSVAARTFVRQRNLQVDDSTKSQVYKSKDELKVQWGDAYDEKMGKIEQAVTATKGEVLTYKGECISAVFFSSTPGHTANAEEYWTNATPYLRSVASPWDQQVNDGNVQTKTISKKEAAQLLGFESPISQIGKPIYYDSGYVKEETIDGITFSGREIREKLSLRSSSFQIEEDGDNLIFTTTGFGHGIGMSQYGAQGMALEGKTYQDILTHYYTYVKIEKIEV